MGQYIRTRIITQFSIHKGNFQEMKMDPGEARIGLVNTIIGNPECFDCQEEEDPLGGCLIVTIE